MYGKRVGAQGESKRKLIMDLEIDDRHNPILIKSNHDSYQTINNDKILWIPDEVAKNRLN